MKYSKSLMVVLAAAMSFVTSQAMADTSAPAQPAGGGSTLLCAGFLFSGVCTGASASVRDASTGMPTGKRQHKPL